MIRETVLCYNCVLCNSRVHSARIHLAINSCNETIIFFLHTYIKPL